MRWVLYAIVDAAEAAAAQLPPGLDAAPIRAIEHGELAALLSPISEATTASAGVEQALAYARVVGELHRRMTVLPMRFGCFVHRPEDAAEFLRRYDGEFSEALALLEGCDEMGVRILLRGEEERSGHRAGSQPPEELPAKGSGTAYLLRRRAYYDRQASADEACRRWAERAEAALAGTFRSSNREHVGRPEGRLVSLSFLVERHAVPAFRQAFEGFQQSCTAPTVCTGPWPPYRYAAGLAKPAMAAQSEIEFLQHEKG